LQHPDEVKASLRLELSQHSTNCQAERYCLRPQALGLLSLSEEVAGGDQIIRHFSIRPKPGPSISRHRCSQKTEPAKIELRRIDEWFPVSTLVSTIC